MEQIILDNGFLNINGNYDMFNPIQCHTRHENVDNLKKVLNLDSKGLTIYGRNYPLEFIDKLFTLVDEPIITHKLFCKHLDDESNQVVIDKSSFIFILERNPVDVYISLKRAIEMASEKCHEDVWIRVDTTNYKIRFDIAEYERIKRNIVNG